MNIEYIKKENIKDLAVQFKGKPAVYIHVQFTPEPDINEEFEIEIILKALDDNYKEHFGLDFYKVLLGGLFFFDTDEEAREFYNPFEYAPLNSSSVYACLYQNGVVVTENT